MLKYIFLYALLVTIMIGYGTELYCCICSCHGDHSWNKSYPYLCVSHHCDCKYYEWTSDTTIVTPIKSINKGPVDQWVNSKTYYKRNQCTLIVWYFCKQGQGSISLKWAAFRNPYFGWFKMALSIFSEPTSPNIKFLQLMVWCQLTTNPYAG